MLTMWMGYSLLFSALVAVVALAADHVLGIWQQPRRVLWIAALVVGTLVPAAGAFRPAPRIRATRTLAQVRTAAQGRVAFRAAPTRPTLARRLTVLALRNDRYTRRAWPAISLLLLALFIRGAVGLARRRATWRTHIVRGVPVLVAPDAGPAVVGILRPRIVVPEWALELQPAELDLLLRHEQEHLEARDPRALVLATIALIVFPWNAPLWWVAHRLRVAVEIDCDARVIRAVRTPREYGLLLLAVGERRSLALPLSASLAERRSLLERRIHAMTTSRPRYPLIASLPFAAIAVAAGVAAAQASPPAPVGGVIRAMTESNLVATASRISTTTTLTPEQMRTLIAAHHPGTLQGDPDMSRLAVVLDANDNYVKSVVRAPFAGTVRPATAASVTGAGGVAVGGFSMARADSERVITAAAAAATGGAVNAVRVSTAGGSGGFAAGSTSSGAYGTMNIAGLGEISGDAIRAVETVRYAPGEMGANAVNVLVIKLK